MVDTAAPTTPAKREAKPKLTARALGLVFDTVFHDTIGEIKLGTLRALLRSIPRTAPDEAVVSFADGNHVEVK
jgi:hypothetical protein